MSLLNIEHGSAPSCSKQDLRPVKRITYTEEEGAADGKAHATEELIAEAVAETDCKKDLFLVIANETRAQSHARQTFVFSGEPSLQLVAISNMPLVNRQSPLVQDLERVVCWLHKAEELDHSRRFSLGPGEENIAPALKSYPFKNLIWTPLRDNRGNATGGILYAREQTWTKQDLALLNRLTTPFSEQLNSLKAKTFLRRAVVSAGLLSNFRKLALGAAACAIFAMFLPITMRVSAPFQVVSKDQVNVSAPIQGIIEEVLVPPGAQVVKGQALVKFVDTLHQNQVSVAKQELDLTQARWRQANQLSFDSEEGRRKLGLSIAELAVKKAELKLAEDESSRTLLTASTSGVAIYSDASALKGKPISVGEKILQIADPDQVEFEISLGIGDSIALEEGASARLFLDAKPFSPIETKITEIGYQAEPTPTGQLAYTLVAIPDGELSYIPTLGTSGTAKIYGDRVPLAFYLFRRPISATRQWLGI